MADKQTFKIPKSESDFSSKDFIEGIMNFVRKDNSPISMERLCLFVYNAFAVCSFGDKFAEIITTKFRCRFHLDGENIVITKEKTELPKLRGVELR